jgi:hypothetical protein
MTRPSGEVSREDIQTFQRDVRERWYVFKRDHPSTRVRGGILKKAYKSIRSGIC